MLNNVFQPNWASAPGDTVIDILRERDISIDDFARQIQFSPENVQDLLDGMIPITLATARMLQKTLGASIEFWISRDFQYRQSIIESNIANEQWINELPIDDMIRFGWIPKVSTLSDKLFVCLEYFGVPNVKEWNEKYAGVMQTVAFKKTQAYESRFSSVAAWIRQGELKAREINCKSWNAKTFEASLSNIKSLIREKDPAKFIPELTNYCAECGVALEVVRTPHGCPMSGATKFIFPDKALLLLSFRFLTDDHFWFSFFHEAGHLLLHSNKKVFLEMTDIFSVAEEDEANRFAENILIPTQYRQELFNINLNAREILRFASKIDVSPGIVVGQLSHYGLIPPNYFLKLKRHYKWID
jgi:HTH-type transcriptional regulator / antitoxin HigA